MTNKIRAISENGGIVVCAIDSTAICTEMERIHKPSAVVSAALGRLLTGAALMGSWLKTQEDSITLRVNGGGPVGTLVAVVDANGHVRGYADNPIVEIPLNAFGKLDVGGAVGNEGTLTVVKDIHMKEPYTGRIPLVSGEIAEDITSYYAISEQTPTVCALGVLVNPDLSIQKAGGFLMQLLPGATDAEITKLEENLAKMPAVTQLLQDGGTPMDMINMALDGFSPNVLEEETAEYRCNCSREKTLDMLAALGRDELEALQREEETLQVECHYCDKKYQFTVEEILQKTN